jgi:hypothetical protein
MSEYRARLGIGMVTAATPTPAQSTSTNLGYINLGLPSQLTIDDENDMSWPEVSLEGLSVDEEFRTYNSTKRTAINQDLLSYWEVSCSYFHM